MCNALNACVCGLSVLRGWGWWQKMDIWSVHAEIAAAAAAVLMGMWEWESGEKEDLVKEKDASSCWEGERTGLREGFQQVGHVEMCSCSIDRAAW